MTKNQLEKLADHWIPILGLRDWEFEIRVEDFKPVSHSAQNQHGAFYDQSVIRFQQWMLDSKPPPNVIWRCKEGDITNAEIERTLVHELLHSKFHRLGMAQSLARPGMKKESWKIFNEAYEDAEENLVDSLAANLVEAFGVYREA